MFRILKFPVLSLLFAFILISNQMDAQNGNNPVVLLQGKIIDSQTGQPVGTGIQFVNSAGTKIQTRSNPNNGAYQQVLAPNEDYIVMFKDYIITNESKSFKTPNVSEYHEENYDFRIMKITTGMELFRFNGFEANGSQFTSSGERRMKELKEMLSYNSKVNVILTINMSDCNFKPIKKSIPDETAGTKKKKKNKTITITPEQQFSDAFNARINSVKETMRKNSISERLITFESSNAKISASAPKQKDSKKKDKKAKTTDTESPKTANVVITVGKIMNL